GRLYGGSSLDLPRLGQSGMRPDGLAPFRVEPGISAGLERLPHGDALRVTLHDRDVAGRRGGAGFQHPQVPAAPRRMDEVDRESFDAGMEVQLGAGPSRLADLKPYLSPLPNVADADR